MDTAKVTRIESSKLKQLTYPNTDGVRSRSATLPVLAIAFASEIRRAIKAGRIPADAARIGIEMVSDELTDILMEESFSWDESLQSWAGGERNRAGEA